MRALRITAKGLPLFKDELDIDFYAKQRVDDDDKENLFKLGSNIYLHTEQALIGINASGKTSVLKVVYLALNILKNEPLNHIDSRMILGGTKKAVFNIYFCDSEEYICCLETEITSEKMKNGEYSYSIVDEKLWRKPISKVKSKKTLTDFSGMEPESVRDKNEAFLPDDVSFIIAHNKKYNDTLDISSLISYTNVNVLPFLSDIPAEVVAYLDPSIEYLRFEKVDERTIINLKFYDEEKIILNNTADLEQYLSSGTIKGMIVFSMVKEILVNGGYLLVDEIENHFNKEIVMTIIRFFRDNRLNRNGGTLIFTTHYPEILDEYDRNDSIYIIRNRNGITAENLSTILKRNDIKKSDAYQSGFLEGTTPAYESYMDLKRKFADAVYGRNGDANA